MSGSDQVICPNHGLIQVLKEEFKHDGRHLTLACDETVKYEPSMSPDTLGNAEAQAAAVKARTQAAQAEAAAQAKAAKGVPTLKPTKPRTGGSH